jgi:hypothetical protein
MMNERIKELLQEAYTHFGHGKYRTSELVAEKFAELIVRECVDVCLSRHYTWRWDDEPDSSSGPRDCAQSIKEHFGVEE